MIKTFRPEGIESFPRTILPDRIEEGAFFVPRLIWPGLAVDAVDTRTEHSGGFALSAFVFCLWLDI
jgi:hypothetical protein